MAGDLRHRRAHYDVTVMAKMNRMKGNSPHKGQWRGALMFSLICSWINGWVNNREVGDLRRHRAHSDVIVMMAVISFKYHCFNNYFSQWTLNGWVPAISHAPYRPSNTKSLPRAKLPWVLNINVRITICFQSLLVEKLYAAWSPCCLIKYSKAGTK